MSAVARPALFRRVAALAAVLAIGGATVATAVPVGGAVDNPRGAVATVANQPVAPGGTATFSGTGFSDGESVTVKIDDGDIKTTGGSDQFTVVTAAPDGTISGSVDLAQANQLSPVAAGEHWLRFLSLHQGLSRSLKATFTVGVAQAPTTPGGDPAPTTGTGGAGTTTPTTPTATTPRGPIWLTDTLLKRTKTKKKVALKLAAGPRGSAGTVSVQTKNTYKIGKGKATKRAVAKSTAYFVDELGTATLNLTLTPEAKTLLARKKELKAIVTLKDANGEDTVKTEVKVQR